MHNKSDRREFIKGGIATTAAVLAGGPAHLFGSGEARAESLPDVVVCSGKSAAAITRSAVEALGGMKRFVKQGARVVIKPNMSFDRAVGTGANTNPNVVAEVARMCAEAGAARISVLDYPLRDPRDCLRMSMIPALCRGIPNTYVNTIQSHRMFRPVKVKGGAHLSTMDVASEVLDSDVLIAVPVGKTHSSAGVSLTMKGMMGLIWDRHSFHGRYNLDEAIVDMVTVLKPALSVIDGTNILSTGGPGGPGKVIPLNLVVASTDMVAADSQMVSLGTWYGRKFSGKNVRHIRLAAQRGLGRMDIEKLNVKKIRA
jgi:uncharacterized protein (DUF362 family)